MHNLFCSFDVVFDCVGTNSFDFAMSLLNKSSKSVYVTIVTPIMPSTDKYGVVLGGLMAVADRICNTLKVCVL